WRSAEARALRKSGFRRVSRAEDLYWRRCTAPMQEAAAALAFTPAPDLAAVRAKIAVLRAHDSTSTRCCRGARLSWSTRSCGGWEHDRLALTHAPSPVMLNLFQHPGW